MSLRRLFRHVAALPPALWLGAFFALPFLIVLRISLSEKVTAQPPYRPILDLSAGWEGIGTFLSQLNLFNYSTILDDELMWGAYVTSLRIAALATLLTLLVGLMLALPMARAPRRLRPLLIMLLVLPFLTSFLIRAYAWIAILKPEGLLNGLLMSLGLISEPLIVLNTETAILIGIVYSYLPFMVFPLYTSLEKMDASLLEAAADLGATPLKSFFLVTVPCIWPGVLAGCALVFIPAVGEFIIPDLLGSSETLMIGRALWNEFFANRDWPLAAAMAICLLAVVLLPVIWQQRQAETTR
ncbi:MAG TPA: ABC transporter permease subunit [Beijerinckiaceae bacterium]|nr:ABC transporter permease subunit [Beijerinckiaceae bacterium]